MTSKDNLTPTQRSYCMSMVRNKNSNLEELVNIALKRVGIRPRPKRNLRALPGSPDFVFVDQKLVIFVDGDFWHGYRFNTWKQKLNSFWKRKIQININRDRRNFSKLRRLGWKVFRIWGHTVFSKNFDKKIKTIALYLEP